MAPVPLLSNSHFSVPSKTNGHANILEKEPMSNLSQLLAHAASNSKGVITFYPGEGRDRFTLTYRMLKECANRGAQLINTIPGLRKDSVILLHFNSQEDNLVWFWAAIEAGYLPAMSTPLVNDIEQRKNHLDHLHRMLKDPVILTTKDLASDFSCTPGLKLYDVASLDKNVRLQSDPHDGFFSIGGLNKNPEDNAVLMLTSGSTGHAKAVALRHGQLLKAVAGKSAHHNTTPEDVFFNWVGLDHVAALCQIHLHALSLGASQIHAKKEEIGANPMLFLEHIHNHRVSVTFGPNFFLARLTHELNSRAPYSMLSLGLDLSCLKAIFSGGEASLVQTSVNVTKHLHRLGGEGHIVSPGFGMTETCAGSTHNILSPEYDVGMNLEFAALGPCTPGARIRVVDELGKPVENGNIGHLQMQGDVLFKEYYNNPEATAEAFVSDIDGDWFITGDKAYVDQSGYLNLAGRAKDMIIVNGVNYYPHELESAIDDARIPGIEPSFNVVFAFRPTGSQTEQVIVAYNPDFAHDDAERLAFVADQISKVSARLFGVSPYKIIPLPKSMLPKTTLGKISRAKISRSFEFGNYDDIIEKSSTLIYEHRQSCIRRPETDLEKAVANVFSEMFTKPLEDIGVESSLLDMGVSSIELISFKNKVQARLGLKKEIPLISVLTNPTIGGVAFAAQELERPKEYNPVVTLNPHGSKTPLWLVHPGVGEILVFLNLAAYITDRPVYALRARGFEEGETFFENLDEIFTTYHSHMKKYQPHGPYAIAGYSFGTMIAFEIGKIIESEGEEVGFLGSFNLPPHIKERMKQLDWTEAGINLSYFLDLLTENYAHEISPMLHAMGDRDKVVDYIIDVCAPQERIDELSMTKEKLKTWVSLAHSMQEAALEYEPSGSIAKMDVFHAIPLKLVAKDRDDWVNNKLSKWADFTRSPPKFHKVEGAHYTMMGPEHVFSFQKILQRALTDRGL